MTDGVTAARAASSCRRDPSRQSDTGSDPPACPSQSCVTRNPRAVGSAGYGCDSTCRSSILRPGPPRRASEPLSDMVFRVSNMVFRVQLKSGSRLSRWYRSRHYDHTCHGTIVPPDKSCMQRLSIHSHGMPCATMRTSAVTWAARLEAPVSLGIAETLRLERPAAAGGLVKMTGSAA